MGKAVLFLVASMALTSGVFMFAGLQRSVFQADGQFNEQAAQLLARQVALTAMSEARTGFLSAPSGFTTSSTTYSGTFEGGTFETSLIPESSGLESTVRIRVEGRMPYGEGQIASHTIETTYRLGAGGGAVSPSTQVPEYMSYALLLNNDLEIGGRATIHASPQSNANVHTNGVLRGNGNAARVEGYGTYAGGADFTGQSSDTYQPKFIVPGQSPVYRVDPVEIPSFDASRYRSMADEVSGTVSLGNLQLGGSREDPKIWYVDGDLALNGGTVTGYGLLVVKGNVTINGNVTTSGPDNSHLTIYTEGDVEFTMNGNATIHGNLFVNGDLKKFNGNATLYGSMTVRGSAEITGNYDLYYREVSPTLTLPDPSEPGELTWQAASYREWASIQRTPDASGTAQS